MDKVEQHGDTSHSSTGQTKLQACSAMDQLREAVAHRRKVYGQTAEDFKTLFRAMDQDGDGELTVAEFRQAMDRVGLSLSHLDLMAVCNAMDTDENGTISCDEFVAELFNANAPTCIDPIPNDSDFASTRGAEWLLAADEIVHSTTASKSVDLQPPAMGRSLPDWVCVEDEHSQDASSRSESSDQERTAELEELEKARVRAIDSKNTALAADIESQMEALRSPSTRLCGIDVNALVAACGVEDAGGAYYRDTLETVRAAVMRTLQD